MKKGKLRLQIILPMVLALLTFVSAFACFGRKSSSVRTNTTLGKPTNGTHVNSPETEKEIDDYTYGYFGTSEDGNRYICGTWYLDVYVQMDHFGETVNFIYNGRKYVGIYASSTRMTFYSEQDENVVIGMDKASGIALHFGSDGQFVSSSFEDWIDTCFYPYTGTHTGGSN